MKDQIARRRDVTAEIAVSDTVIDLDAWVDQYVRLVLARHGVAVSSSLPALAAAS